ncbi:class I SAM-dependent methyltransferase [Nocardioides sp. cx-173]|uniref:class I SAM-dependent methyltransferase n=1 Tax=Nocardioides sp. cx-173 TaxID=2898796 RepID=UPI001E3329B0|nr:class I SAM-dependent methyltransferase [Nocardioides sp. cx-173]MCD4524762.1 methyltransferase domain-containing protein [Nocardioides sp. cx-173]UGB43270.1 methyltransferase domain-containing protein [Nocardioides sp. cx-173]
MTGLLEYPRRYCSVCHQVVRREFRPGPGGRPNASCPRCRSLERHRFFAILLSVLGPTLEDLDTLLEVAPATETSPILGDLGARRHLRLDLGADNRLVDVLGSLTDLPLADDSVDLLVCYHVLEHIPDDRAAMREMARVLSTSGIALLQVPFRAGKRTDEDPDAPEEERVRRFGQVDHVRFYGDDFEDRLVESGLAIQRVTPRSLLGAEMSTWLHVNPDELVWIARPLAGAEVPPRELPRPTSLTRSLTAMLGELTRLHGELDRQRQETRRLRSVVDRLRQERDRPLGIKESARAGALAVRRRVGRTMARD